MTKRGLNLYELIFAIFFLMKITKTGVVADWNWFFVFLPIIINFVHKFFVWIWEGTGMGRSINQELSSFYIEHQKKQYVKKALREARKK